MSKLDSQWSDLEVIVVFIWTKRPRYNLQGTVLDVSLRLPSTCCRWTVQSVGLCDCSNSIRVMSIKTELIDFLLLILWIFNVTPMTLRFLNLTETSSAMRTVVLLLSYFTRLCVFNCLLVRIQKYGAPNLLSFFPTSSIRSSFYTNSFRYRLLEILFTDHSCREIEKERRRGTEEGLPHVFLSLTPP